MHYPLWAWEHRKLPISVDLVEYTFSSLGCMGLFIYIWQAAPLLLILVA